MTISSLVSWVNDKCLQSFFLLLSLRLKDTDTCEEAVIVGIHGRWGRGAACWLLPASCSSSFLHSLVSSSLTSRRGPRVWPRSWLTSPAFRWAFSTADTQARRLGCRQTSTRYNYCISSKWGKVSPDVTMLLRCLFFFLYIPHLTQAFSTVVELWHSHTNTLVQLLQQDTTYSLHLLKIWESD